MRTSSRFFRRFGMFALGALALAATLGLGGCGGSSSSGTTTSTNGTLTAGPATFVAFGNTPNTVGITGGTGPFTVRSSDSTLISVPATVTGASFTFTPKNVAVATAVTLTVTDKLGATSTVTATVTPATIPSGLITITPASTSTCSRENNSGISVATMCSGEAGFASVTLKDINGAVIPNRPVRFEALTLGATMAPNATDVAFSRIATVNTDANGVAKVAIKTEVEVSSEAAFLRATDTVSTHRVDTWVVVLKQTNSASDLSTVPATGGFVGYYSSECPFVRRAFNVYGGKAPFAVTLAAGSTLILSGDSGPAAAGAGVTVGSAGGQFTVDSLASTSCATSSSSITVTDSLGATQIATFSIAPGTTSRPTATTDLAVAPITTSLQADLVSTYCSTSKTRYTITGGTAPYVVTASIPQISASMIDSSTVEASFVSDGKWKMLKGQSASVLILDSAGKVAVVSLNCT